MSIRSRSLAAAAATLALSAVAAPGANAVLGDDQQTGDIVNGQYATDTQGAVSMSLSDGSAWCSGSLLTPTKVLTAQHCTDGLGVQQYYFRVGSLSRESGGTVHKATKVQVQNDVAVVTLATPATGAKTVTLATTEPAVGDTNQLYGWGRTGYSDPASPRLKYTNVPVTSLNARDAYGGPAIQTGIGDGHAWKGDSGGPQFANGKQVGVCSVGVFGEYQNYSSVPKNLAFIKAAAGI